jgi:hypothetical protein
MEQMAADAISFIKAKGFEQVDLFGFDGWNDRPGNTSSMVTVTDGPNDELARPGAAASE